MSETRTTLLKANDNMETVICCLRAAENSIDGNASRKRTITYLRRTAESMICLLQGAMKDMSDTDKEQIYGLEWVVTRNPTYSPDDQSQGEYLYYCPKCNTRQCKPSKYCPDCGVKFDWNS